MHEAHHLPVPCVELYARRPPLWLPRHEGCRGLRSRRERPRAGAHGDVDRLRVLHLRRRRAAAARASRRPAASAWRRTGSTDMRCTWKIDARAAAATGSSLLENAMETYHTGIVHKDTVGTQSSRTLATRGDWLCIQVISGRSIATLPGDRAAVSADRGARRRRPAGHLLHRHPPDLPVRRGAGLHVVAQRHAAGARPLAARDRRLLPRGTCWTIPTSPPRPRPTTSAGRPSAARTSASSRSSSSALSSVLYRPGPLSWRDDEVQAIGIWVLDHLDLV